MKIGLFGGGFKPLTKGHYAVIKKAASENDHVFLYVSTHGRERPGEFPIKGTTMLLIWRKLLEKIMPSNVTVEYVKHPVGGMLEKIYDANDSKDASNEYYVYTDTQDKRHFDNPGKHKRLAFMWENGLINLVPLERMGNGASGTKTRKYLELGLVDEFSKELPEPVQHLGKEIFDLLGAKEA